MLLDIGDWDVRYDEFFTQNEIWIVSITYLATQALSTFIFLRDSAFAIYYYDEVLQERYEEELEFGPADKEEDIPEELIDDEEEVIDIPTDETSEVDEASVEPVTELVTF